MVIQIPPFHVIITSASLRRRDVYPGQSQDVIPSSSSHIPRILAPLTHLGLIRIQHVLRWQLSQEGHIIVQRPR